MSARLAPAVRLVPAAGVELPRIQALAEACFAGRPRAPGWFARKLAREAVDPARSLLALGPGDSLVGYVLVGAEPGELVAHSAGLGVLPDWRGRGIGAALVRGLLSALRGAAWTGLRVLAEPPLRGFYRDLGFEVQAERHTLWAPGTGTVDLDLRAHPRRAWPLPGLPIAGWRAGTWARTPELDAATLTLADGRAAAHLSREGPAILVQRLCVDLDHADADADADVDVIDDLTRRRILAVLTELRARFARDTAVLLYGCDTVSCVTAALIRAKWRVAQTACEMQRELGDAVDKHAPPAA